MWFTADCYGSSNQWDLALVAEIPLAVCEQRKA